jgi:hypothetical protein
MASIKIPTNFDEQVKLFFLILKKHQEDGENSPLKDYPLVEDEGRTTIAVEADEDAKQLARLAQEKTLERKLAFDPVDETIKDVAAFLKGKYRKNPKELGKWGYTVVGD